MIEIDIGLLLDIKQYLYPFISYDSKAREYSMKIEDIIRSEMERRR